MEFKTMTVLQRSGLKKKLFDKATEKRLERLGKNPQIFHGFDISQILRELDDKSSFLDVGCGFGIDMAQAATIGFKEVVGVDIQLYPEWLKAKAQFPALQHIIIKSSNLPFEDNSFYFVNCFHVLEHVENDQFLLEEIYRVLKKGCCATICVPNRNNLLTMTKLMLKIKNPYLDSTHIREYSFGEIKQKIKVQGFEIVSAAKEGFVLPIPLINKFWHFFTTTYFDLPILNNWLGNTIPYSTLGYNFLVRKPM